MYDFDKVSNRQGTYSMKYDPPSRGKPADVLPMWVADMDFPAPPCVAEAMARYVDFGIYGYSEPDAPYFEVVRNWFERQFNWQVKREWLAVTPGVVNAFYTGVHAFSQPGEGVLIQQPVYYPFGAAIRDTGRTMVVNELVNQNGHYVIDFDDFEAKAKQAKVFILCNPHNPVGRVWKRDELMKMGEICVKYNVTVIADEIWQDLIYPGHKHLVFADLAPEFASITATATAPSKTFNLAGLQLANVFISNPEKKAQFNRAFAASGLSQPNLMGLVSCAAVYEHGEPWMGDLLSYLKGNMDFLHNYIKENIPAVKVTQAEGTYLAWMDCRTLGKPPKELDEAITHKGKLWLNEGSTFGAGGAGFMRINVASPRVVLDDALKRLKTALDE